MQNNGLKKSYLHRTKKVTNEYLVDTLSLSACTKLPITGYSPTTHTYNGANVEEHNSYPCQVISTIDRLTRLLTWPVQVYIDLFNQYFLNCK